MERKRVEKLTRRRNILASVLVIVQPAVQASVSQGELESVVQVQLQFVLGLVLEVAKLAVDSAWKGNVERGKIFSWNRLGIGPRNFFFRNLSLRKFARLDLSSYRKPETAKPLSLSFQCFENISTRCNKDSSSYFLTRRERGEGKKNWRRRKRETNKREINPRGMRLPRLRDDRLSGNRYFSLTITHVSHGYLLSLSLSQRSTRCIFHLQQGSIHPPIGGKYRETHSWNRGIAIESPTHLPWDNLLAWSCFV